MRSAQCLPPLLLLAVVCATADATPTAAKVSVTPPTRHRRDNSRQPENLTAASGRAGRFLNLLSPPAPPPPAAPYYPSSGAAFDDFSASGGDQFAVYDYSNVRNDLAHYSRTLDTVFGLMIALFSVLLLPLLLPLLVTLAAPWLIDKLTEVLSDE